MVPDIEVMQPQEPQVPEVRDLRCDGGKLLARLRMAGGKPSYVHPDNLIELACDECRRHKRKQGQQVKRVLHRYDLTGELIETLVVEDDVPD